MICPNCKHCFTVSYGKSAEEVIKTVESITGVDSAEILSRKRRHRIVSARLIAAYFIRKATRLTLKEVATSLNYADHTQIVWACKQVERMILTDSEYAPLIREMEKVLDVEPILVESKKKIIKIA